MEKEKTIDDKLKELKEKGYIKFMTIGKILAEDFGKDLWVVKDLIPENSITAIAGSPGSFKTWITLEIARCISQGGKLFGKFDIEKTGPVVFIDKENHLKHIQKRLKQLGFVPEYNTVYVTEENFLIDKEDDFKKLKNMISVLKPSLVVFDSLVRIHDGDENVSKDIANVMRKFRIITNKGTSVLFIHHHRKEGAQHKKSANSVRGSSDILAGIDCLLLIEKTKDENSLIIEQAKLRQQQAIEPFKVEIQSNKETGDVRFVYEGEHNPNKAAKEEAKAEILILLSQNSEMFKKDIVDALSDDYGLPTITIALKELEVEQKINRIAGQNNKFKYSLKK